jgi:predicted house-cleaning noncanonical NTP pyrophosphatase (MazG superfamily)
LVKKYNKAIRDKIPEIIKKDDYTCNVETMNDEKYLVEMEKKLSEEVAEYQNDKNSEELADILEVIYKIAKLKGISKEQLEKIRLDKVEKRGAFEDNLFLIDTDSSPTRHIIK